MREFFGWFGRAILLPLLPAVVGCVMRSVFSSEWGFGSVDSAELAFCIGLVGVIALTGVHRLPDKPLRDALSPLFVITLAIALCLFAGSLLMNGYHAREQAQLLESLKKSDPIDMALLKVIGVDDRCTAILARLRSSTIIVGTVTILLALVTRLRYNIDDDMSSPARQDGGAK